MLSALLRTERERRGLLGVPMVVVLSMRMVMVSLIISRAVRRPLSSLWDKMESSERDVERTVPRNSLKGGGGGLKVAVGVAPLPLTCTSTSSEIDHLTLTGVELETQFTEGWGQAAQVACNRLLGAG